jgi:hypothetical protein
VDEAVVLQLNVGRLIGWKQQAQRCFAGGELGPLLGESRPPIAPGLLAALTLGILLGQVLLDRGRRDPPRELGEHLRPGELRRLADALPVGAREPLLVNERLCEQEAQNDSERVLGRLRLARISLALARDRSATSCLSSLLGPTPVGTWRCGLS